MLFSDMTLAIILMVNIIMFHQAFAENEISKKENHSRFGWNQKNDQIQEIIKKHRLLWNKHRRNSYLDPILIKLNNVIGKYDIKKSDLNDLYFGVVRCGVKRCEKFSGLIPENQKIRHITCFHKNNGFKKMVSDLLSSFHKGVQRIDKSFQVLINYEKAPHLHDKRRRKILEELKVDIKMLNVEIESVLTSKSPKLFWELEGPVLSYFPRPENQTNLMIYEWRIIQDTKRFLREWRRNLNKLYRCWKKRRQENLKKKKENNDKETKRPGATARFRKKMFRLVGGRKLV